MSGTVAMNPPRLVPRLRGQDGGGAVRVHCDTMPCGGDEMTAVRARYENGVLTPLEPLDLAEGAEVMVSVDGSRAETAERPNFVEHLLAIPKGGPDDLFERLPMKLRDTAW